MGDLLSAHLPALELHPAHLPAHDVYPAHLPAHDFYPAYLQHRPVLLDLRSPGLQRPDLRSILCPAGVRRAVDGQHWTAGAVLDILQWAPSESSGMRTVEK